MYEGRLVRLRAYEPADVDTLYELFNDPEVTQELLLRYPLARADEAAFVAASSPVSYGTFNLAVETLAERRLIGSASLRTKGPENRTAELGVAIGDKTLWGQGYGTDAVRTLCRAGFDVLDLHRIELWVFETNARARRLYERLGFVHEGTARESMYKNGRRLDQHLMGLLRSELRD